MSKMIPEQTKLRGKVQEAGSEWYKAEGAFANLLNVIENLERHESQGREPMLTLKNESGSYSEVRLSPAELIGPDWRARLHNIAARLEKDMLVARQDYVSSIVDLMPEEAALAGATKEAGKLTVRRPVKLEDRE